MLARYSAFLLERGAHQGDTAGIAEDLVLSTIRHGEPLGLDRVWNEVMKYYALGPETRLMRLVN